MAPADIVEKTKLNYDKDSDSQRRQNSGISRPSRAAQITSLYYYRILNDSFYSFPVSLPATQSP